MCVENPKPHRCAPASCHHCKQRLTPEALHKCYIQPLKKQNPDNYFIFFDLETRFENGKHTANFACAITCNGVEFTAEGSDCVEHLLKYFRSHKYVGYTWMAHNAGGFDNLLLMEHFSKIGVMPKIIMTGCRLTFMYDERFQQRFIDSYSFIPMRLANTTAAFSLNTCDKGYFPHRFNTSVNNNYIGPYPTKWHYGYDTMSDKDRLAFNVWYSDNSGGVFDFQKELYAYGRNDVVLLREACLKYQEVSMTCTCRWQTVKAKH